MSEQYLHIGDHDLALAPENPDLQDLIAQSEQEQTVSIEQQHQARSALEDFPPIPGQEHIHEKIAKHFGIRAMAPEARHATEWLKLHDAQSLEELKRLNGQIVLDLGGGLVARQFQGFIKQFGARQYIGVDSRASLGARRRQSIDGFGEIAYLDEADEMAGALVRGDLLRVASRLPDNSVSVALNGIDDFIVKSDSPYGQRLMDEVIRILHPEGLIMGVQNQSGILSFLMGRKELRGINFGLPGREHFKAGAGFYLIHKAGVK